MSEESGERLWYDACINEVQSLFDVRGFLSDEERENRICNCARLSRRFFLRIVKDLKIRSDWETYLDMKPQTTGVRAIASKNRINLSLGVGYCGFYLESSISCPERLSSMDNEFWSCITDVERLGEAALCNDGNGSVGNSLVYQLAHTQIHAEIDESASPVGWIEMTTGLDADFDTLVAFYKNGIRLLYRANYLLYRSRYIYLKQQEKRLERKHGQKITLI